MTMHRAFLAIDFSESFKRQIGEYALALGPAFAGCRLSWVDPRIFHLTLHFFGDIDDSGISALKDGFSAIAGSIAPPRFAIAGMAYLPGAANPKILCLNLAMEPGEALAPLIAEAKAMAAGLGAINDARPWKAHLTVARIKEGRLPPVDATPAIAAMPHAVALPPLSALPIPPRLEYSSKSFELMESFLSPRGPRYATLASFAFSGFPASGSPLPRP